MPFLTFLLGHWRTLGVLAIVFALGSYGAVMRLQRDHARAEFDKEHAAAVEFRLRVAAEGAIARQRAEAIQAHDELLKEEANEDHRQALDKLHVDVARLRGERDRARSDFLSATAPSASGADRACFDRAEFVGAYRDLVAEVRGAADEGSAAIVDLDAAKAWARATESRSSDSP